MAGTIEARGIGKLFGAFRALDDVSLEIDAGEFLTLLGPSGSGKTTFLMTLSGFLKPDEGVMLLDGVDVTARPPEQRGFGMVFQGYALFPHMSVKDNIAFPLKVQKRSASAVSARVDEMVEMVGLSQHAHKKPAALSGGQQQRVALARALACEPPVLLLDEPFSALDKNLRGEMQEEMRRIHRDLGTTFVFVTHDQSEALSLSSKVAIFDHGRLQQFGTPEEVYEAPSNRFVAEFLGEINLLPAKIRGETAIVEGHEIAVPGNGRFRDGEHLVGVRPEHMGIDFQPAGGDRNSFEGQITDIIYQGSSRKLALMTDGGSELTINIPSDTRPGAFTAGARVWVNWKADQCLVL